MIIGSREHRVANLTKNLEHAFEEYLGDSLVGYGWGELSERLAKLIDSTQLGTGLCSVDDMSYDAKLLVENIADFIRILSARVE